MLESLASAIVTSINLELSIGTETQMSNGRLEHGTFKCFTINSCGGVSMGWF